MRSGAWKRIVGLFALAALGVALALALFRTPPTPAPAARAPVVTARVATPATPAPSTPAAPPRIVPAERARPPARSPAAPVVHHARPRSTTVALHRAHRKAHHPAPPHRASRRHRAAGGQRRPVEAAPGIAQAAEAPAPAPVEPATGPPVAVSTPAPEAASPPIPATEPPPAAAPAPAPAVATLPRDAPASPPRATPPSAPDLSASPEALAIGPSHAVNLSVGTGRLIRLPRRMAHLFVADDRIADVQVQGPTALYLFAKLSGHTTVYATDAAGAVIWASDVRVGANLADVATMLRVALPEARITATPLNGIVLLTGTVLSPADVADAQRIVEQATAGTMQVLNGLKVATPQQVSLHVKIAEVNRNVARAIGFNYRSADKTGGLLFGIAQGRAGAITDDLTNFTHSGVGTTLALGGKLLGLDIRQAIDLAETDGFASTLAEPNLTALSGETASFLAGGEIPIPQSQGLGSVSVEFKQYGVSLAFTPTVMSGGRIALRVRPEVSQLSDVGSVKINGFTIPSLITRRAETTVELGSGQSFAIGGLLQNTHNNSFDKAPLLGDLPVIGALFRSNSFQKQETELVIVVTPYLVKPVDANRIALPADGYRSPTTAERVLLGKMYEDGGVFGVAPAALDAGAAPVAVADPVQ